MMDEVASSIRGFVGCLYVIIAILVVWGIVAGGIIIWLVTK